MAILRHDIFDELRTDHREIMEIFDQLMQTDEQSVNRRNQLVGQLRDELLPHMIAEEGMIYPLMENGQKSHALHMHADEEHRAARLVLAELARTDPHDEHFVARCDVLRNLIRMHVAEEESVVFLTIRSKITNQQTVDLVPAFQKAKDDFRKQQKGTERRAA